MTHERTTRERAPTPLDATARAALRAKAEAATPGPWHAATKMHPEAVRLRREAASVYGPDCLIYTAPRDYACEPETWQRQRADAEFIAAVSPDVILALLAAVERGEEDTARIDWLFSELTTDEIVGKTEDVESAFIKLGRYDHDAVRAAIDAAHSATTDDPRSNGTTTGHEPDVLPQGMTFHAGELGDAYVAGAKSGRDHQPTDEQIARACDAYVKHAHLIRLTAKET